MKDYYKILGIEKNVKQEEIKKAYRKLAAQYHPDKNPNGAALMVELNDAYNTLESEKKRKEYDDLVDCKSSITVSRKKHTNDCKTNEILNNFDDLKI